MRHITPSNRPPTSDLHEFRKSASVFLEFVTEPFTITALEGPTYTLDAQSDHWDNGYYVTWPTDGTDPYPVAPSFVWDNYELVPPNSPESPASDPLTKITKALSDIRDIRDLLTTCRDTLDLIPDHFDPALRFQIRAAQAVLRDNAVVYGWEVDEVHTVDGRDFSFGPRPLRSGHRDPIVIGNTIASAPEGGR